MYKLLIAAALSLGIATAQAAPAAAQSNEDLLRALGIATGMYVIGKEIRDRRDERKAEEAARQQTDRYYAHQAPPAYGRYTPPPSRHAGRIPPSAFQPCLRQQRERGGWRTYYDDRCVKRVEEQYTRGWDKRWKDGKGDRWARECLRRRWTAQGWETYHDRRCLRDHGDRNAYRD